MKKIFLTFFALVISFNITFAEDWECAIKNDAAPILKEYIKNTKEITKKITQAISEEKEKSSDWTLFDPFSINWVWKVNSFFRSAYSKIFNYEWYFSYFEFWAVFPISNEIPYEIKRDYKLLQRENNSINSYLKTIARKGLTWTKIENICDWVSFLNCNLPANSTVWDLITIIIDNHNAVSNIYRNVVMWKTTEMKEPYVLVPDNFEEELKNYYSPEKYSTCSKEKWWFFDKIEKSFDKITDYQNNYKNWVQKWIDAWDLAQWKDTSKRKYSDIERQLLARELARNWIQWDSQRSMLEALAKFNQEWLTKDSNLAYNTFNNTWNRLAAWLKKLKDDTIWDFFNKPEQKNKPMVKVDEILKAQNNSVTINDLKQRINKLYLQLSQSEATSQQNATNLISRMIKTHIDILQGIDSLSKACEKAREVCLKQDPNKWNCWKCN